MKTNNKLGAYILRGSMGALLFSCMIVALCSAIHLPEQPRKAPPAQDNAALSANGHESRSLSFADRVAYQRAIEDVYWRHRIWPRGGGERPDPKPSLDALMSHAQLEKKVEGYLRNSQELEDYWQKPITPEQLQAEMDRMAQHTKQPEVLRELFDALDNDPFVIAECLARPVLAERMITSSQVTRAKVGLSTPKVMAAANANYSLPAISDQPSGCTDDTWTPTSLTNTPDGRYYHTAVWTGSEMIVWGGGRGFTGLKSGGRYNPSTDSWTATSITDAPAARFFHTAVWTGTEMIVWGGQQNGTTYLNTGGRYNPGTDSWTATSITGAPEGRDGHTAVWTGSEMIVWGGFFFDGTGHDLNTGSRYNPGTDSWTATSITNAPEGRSGHTAVWTGSEMTVWGGVDSNGSYVDTGGRYSPSTNSWTATSTTNAPTGRYYHTAVWTGSEMIVWGGKGFHNYFNSGGRYCAQAGSPITLSAAKRKVGGINTVRLTWSGATSTDIDVYRDGVVIVTTANDGSYTDSTGDTGRARYMYRVCEAGTSTCSNNAGARFPQ